MKYLYVLTSDDADFYLEQALLSITSLRMHTPNAFVSVLCDTETEANLNGKRGEIHKLIDELAVIEIEKRFDKKARSRWLKTSMRKHIKGDFLYLDCDTIVADDLSPIANMNINLGAVLDNHMYIFGSTKYRLPTLRDVENRMWNLGFTSITTSDTYFNGGVLFSRDCTVGHDFFVEWHKLWLFCFEKDNVFDQQSLFQANHNLGNVITRIDSIWNCQIMNHGAIIYLYDSKIIHYYDFTENPFLFANADLYEKIKETGFINQETVEMLHNPKNCFSPDTWVRTVNIQQREYDEKKLRENYESLHRYKEQLSKYEHSLLLQQEELQEKNEALHRYEEQLSQLLVISDKYKKIITSKSFRVMILLRKIAEKIGLLLLLRAVFVLAKKVLKFILPRRIRTGLRQIYKGGTRPQKKQTADTVMAVDQKSQERSASDNIKRQAYDLVYALQPLREINSPRYIVSLTSYGSRLADTAPYAIATLFNQSVRPDKIVLWVAYDDKKRISSELNELTKKGLEIRFCEDIKSYKKLIPSLENFADDCIITADDDVYYPFTWLERLVNEHNKNPGKIICHRAHGIKVDANYNPIPYLKWDYCIEPTVYFAHTFMSQEQSVPRHQLESVFPTGGGGTLYPPRCLHEDITKKELFQKLSPCADDIWFWAMAVLKSGCYRESPFVVIENGYSQDRLQYVDMEYELDSSALRIFNTEQGGNDKQLKAVIEHYPQIKDVLKKIHPYQISNKELFVPNEIKNIYEEVIYLIHIFAYFLDCKYIKERSYRKILDYACGDGYGSYFVANSFPQAEILGVDIDADALSTARSKYERSNLQFKHISEIDGKFDFICVHQIVEHVDDVNFFLDTLKNLLSPDGMIIISTPQREYRLNEGQEPWSFGHKREYTRAGFEDEVIDVFPDAQVYQMSGSRELLLVEYGRCSENRQDKKVYGGVYPGQQELSRKYGLHNLHLHSWPTKDSINLFAIISSDAKNLEKKIHVCDEAQGSDIPLEFNSSVYWERRYSEGGNSGAGGYKLLSQFKADFLNNFVSRHPVNSVIEFCCGDGNQLSLAEYPSYMGFDVSQTAVGICKNKFQDDKAKVFGFMDNYSGETADLALSLDVIYHLIEDNVFESYMERLFYASTKFVIIYSSNKAGEQWTSHVKHRKFTDWIDANKKDWGLLQFVPNKYPATDDKISDHATSFSDFFVFLKNK